jgi:trehalose utilization protein
MDRRTFLAAMIAAAVGPRVARVVGAADAAKPPVGKIRVLVWDEQQPEQKQAYQNFLGNAIADYLRGRPGFSVRSVKFSDPEQGLADEAVKDADVLVWWSHYRTNPLVKPEAARRIVNRIKTGKLSLITLHSGHWSAPFVEAMRDRATDDALKELSEEQRKAAVITFVTPERFAAPKRDDPLTPSVKRETDADGKLHLEITLPICCFPAWRADGRPSHVTTLLPDHPIAKGLPAKWDIAQTEMYDEPFHVPPPDEVVFEEKWDAGEHFRSGCVWKIGKGRVFYFRPGHEIYPVYRQELPLRVIENACRWLGHNRASTEKRAGRMNPENL